MSHTAQMPVWNEGLNSRKVTAPGEVACVLVQRALWSSWAQQNVAQQEEPEHTRIRPPPAVEVPCTPLWMCQ